MAKINDLRALIVAQLNTIKSTYGITDIFYQVAQDTAMFPHIVYDFGNMRALPEGFARRDIELYINVYDKQESTVLINNIADAVEELLEAQNLPQTDILPTFYYVNRKDLPDEDKAIKHIQIEFSIQNYERN